MRISYWSSYVCSSDLLLVLVCRLNIRQISYNYAGFAPDAKKIMVDVDAPELFKPTISIDMLIHADLRTFVPAMIKALGGYEAPSAHRTYIDWAMERRRRYPAVLPE